MISAGIRELKAKLSSYVDKVREGNTIVITEHGQEVGVIIPISRERMTIQNLIEMGKTQWGGGEKPRGVSGVRLKGMPLSDFILEERS
jgi:prevent-host-death family protein